MMINVNEIAASFWLAPGAARISDLEGTSQPLNTLYYASSAGADWLDAKFAAVAAQIGLEPIKCRLEKAQKMGPFKINVGQWMAGPVGLEENAGMLLGRMKALGGYWAGARLAAMLKVANHAVMEEG